MAEQENNVAGEAFKKTELPPPQLPLQLHGVQAPYRRHPINARLSPACSLHVGHVQDEPPRVAQPPKVDFLRKHRHLELRHGLLRNSNGTVGYMLGMSPHMVAQTMWGILTYPICKIT
ncbi:uncharacterized protein J3R85_007752 [Psidium guajava]|nr:uncharacterized protein J3R85_007752 [Psidium guajava]